MIRFLRRLFRREKGYRFPNGIPRVETPDPLFDELDRKWLENGYNFR